MKTIQQKRLSLLEETVKHYSKNPTERRCSKQGECRYSAETLDLPKSTGCAIGRKLSKKKRLELDKQFGAFSVNAVFDRLPKKIKELGVDFLADLQVFHDVVSYWNNEGLTNDGKEEFERIKNKYCK